MATAFFRTVILYLLLIAGLRLSGKRQIGELEPIELVLTLLISDLASVPMQDFALPLFNGVIPIITLIALSTLFSAISLRNVRFRDLVCGQPALVIVDGKLRQETMRRNRLTLDELFEQLRGQGITDISNVGPGLDILGPMENFSILSPLSKLVLSLEMLMGRLELMPLLALFLGSTWRD